jgi:methylmalonyl-CoA epimerase
LTYFVERAHQKRNNLFKVTELNHVGIAVLSIEEAGHTFGSKFGLKVSDRINLKASGLTMALVETRNCVLELMEPIDNSGTVAKFLEKQKRNSIHHIAFSVDSDLQSVAKDLGTLGIDMVYPEPSIGAMGHPVNFCHPKFTSNIMIEVCDPDFETRKKL